MLSINARPSPIPRSAPANVSDLPAPARLEDRIDRVGSDDRPTRAHPERPAQRGNWLGRIASVIGLEPRSVAAVVLGLGVSLGAALPAAHASGAARAPAAPPAATASIGVSPAVGADPVRGYSGSDLGALARARAEDPEWRLGISNEGGTLGIGNCWWHSTFQRHALYRAVMRPDLPKPDSKAAKAILKKLASESGGVVEIPGYSSFREFTGDFAKETRERIDKMHVWMNGIAEAVRLVPLGAPKDKGWAKKSHDSICAELDKGRIVLVNYTDQGNAMFHAGLILGYERGHDASGKEVTRFRFVESNNPSGESTFVYDHAARAMFEHGDKVGLKIMRSSDFGRYDKAKKSYAAAH